ncbi:uncharacterized protein LOC100118791 [Nasonia vitripennis]|uniref:Peptidase S1 domain-containing protein n=1 Tax=Nasonia vitripennis TaxID=7425 RepID=A0A7M7R0S7_NASVI|nr:uncharacterized protein LOC100118791 [Nasonia vitripennis]
MLSKLILLTCLLAVARATRPQLGLRMPDFNDAIASRIVGGNPANRAHCPTSLPYGDLTVKAGKLLINYWETSEQTSSVQRAFIHNQFPGNVAPNDIALLKLATPLCSTTTSNRSVCPKPRASPKVIRPSPVGIRSHHAE